MSINWVMLSETESFVHLPGEQRLYTSPPRTSISLQSLNKYPGREPFSVSSSSGLLHLTNRRLIYIPSPPTATFQSFASPITNLRDTHVTAPWVGPNAWIALVQPVASGGIPAHLPAVEARVTFKDGGAYEFHDKFCRVKERLVQAREARELSGAGGGGGGGAATIAEDVHLEQLPAYEAFAAGGGGSIGSAGQHTGGGVRSNGLGGGGGRGGEPASASIPTFAAPSMQSPQQATAAFPTAAAVIPPTPTALATTADPSLPIHAPTPARAQTSTPQAAPTPDEPPPGYEEAQRSSVVDELEQGLRFRSGRTQRREGDDEEDGR